MNAPTPLAFLAQTAPRINDVRAARVAQLADVYRRAVERGVSPAVQAVVNAIEALPPLDENGAIALLSALADALSSPVVQCEAQDARAAMDSALVAIDDQLLYEATHGRFGGES